MTLLKKAKKALKEKLPRSLDPREAARRITLELTRGVIVSGPFAGMVYGERAGRRVHFPYLLGTHEKEVASALEKLMRSSPRTVVNIGAASGYYAVGCALRMPKARVIAFEADRDERENIGAVAAQNGVAERVDLRGLCDEDGLVEALDGAEEPLVIMDIEGGEELLLDPAKASALRHAEIIVELHDVFVPGLGEVFDRRFSGTHTIEEVRSVPRNDADYPLKINPFIRFLLRRYFLKQMDEGRRGPMRWFIMIPRAYDAHAAREGVGR